MGSTKRKSPRFLSEGRRRRVGVKLKQIQRKMILIIRKIKKIAHRKINLIRTNVVNVSPPLPTSSNPKRPNPPHPSHLPHLRKNPKNHPFKKGLGVKPRLISKRSLILHIWMT